MKRVYICSRYAGDVAENVETAKRLCRMAVQKGVAPFAPHLLYPQFLTDETGKDRETGIACGLAFLEVCDEVWVYVRDGISDGMMREIEHAKKNGKSIKLFGLDGMERTTESIAKMLVLFPAELAIETLKKIADKMECDGDAKPKP